jgi:hypothetical protein
METETISGFEVHPYCSIFPMMDDEAMASLVESIRTNGLIEPIVRHDGQIVDGRNRLRACQAAGVEPKFTEWSEVSGGCTIDRWIWDKNVERRHLSKPQIACAIVARRALQEQIAAQKRQSDAAKQTNGQRWPEKSLPLKPTEATPAPQTSAKTGPTGETREILAKEAGVGQSLIQTALNIQKVNPELLSQVVHGKITINEAANKISPGAPGKLPIEIRSSTAASVNPPVAPQNKRQQIVANSARERMVVGLGHIHGACIGLGELNVQAICSICAIKEVRSWAAEARNLAGKLNEFASKLINTKGAK